MSSPQRPFQAVPSFFEPPGIEPPSTYLPRFHYDCCTFSGPMLRFMIDSIGCERIVFGTDTPAPMVLTDGVRWLRGLDCLSDEEKQMILVENGERLLDPG